MILISLAPAYPVAKCLEGLFGEVTSHFLLDF
jgi:hypothetical protein